MLSAVGIEGYFRFIRGRHTEKDKASLMGELLDKIGSNKAVVVGDRIHDIDAAKENMIPSIGVAYGYGPEEMEKATFVAERPGDILHHINRIRMFNLIEEDILEKEENIKVVGINGVDTSGKTHFSSLLLNYLLARGQKVTLINLDDFHNPSDIRRKGINEIEAYLNNAFNLDYLIEELLQPIKDGQVIDKTIKHLDLETDSYSKEKSYFVDEETIVLLEGVLLYREPVNDFFDYRIFLDVPFSEVLNRARKRDVPLYGEEFLEKYKKKYIPIQQRYIEEHNPLDKSNIVIDNRDYNQPVIKY